MPLPPGYKIAYGENPRFSRNIRRMKYCWRRHHADLLILLIQFRNL